MTTTTAGAAEAPRYASRSGIFGWVMFDWAAQPYYTLITTFIFAPYFANFVASNSVDGQAYWGFATAAAGIVIALLSPILGSIADANGRRKPWIAAFGVLLVVGASAMWIGRPGDPSIILPLLIAYGIATVGVEFATVFNNAMMPTLVPPERIGRLSGTGWATGYLGGIVALILVLGFLAATPSGKTLLGLNPLVDATSHAGDRITGPLTALWFVIFVLPMFLFTPDRPARRKVGDAIRVGLVELRATLAVLPQRRALMAFLIANMIYMDGMVSLFAFGGIYAASTFGWGSVQIGSFGIVTAIAGMMGAFLGGKLDDRFGPIRVIVTSLLMLIAAVTAILLIDRDSIFFMPVAPPVQGRMLAGPAEQAYLALGFLIGAAVGPLQAASRTLLIRLAPADLITQHFGLFALTGKVTAFVGPLIIASVTAFTQSQKAGMAVLLIFFTTGLLMLSRVRQGA